MHNTSPAYDSRSAGHAESGVRIVKEKVRTLICSARELHGSNWKITCFISMVCKICISNNKQISQWNRWNDRLSQSQRSFENATSIRALLGLKRYFTWSCPRERSKSRRSGTSGFSSESKMSLRSLWLERHTELFFREAFAEFQKRILEMVCCSTASKEPPRNYNKEMKEESGTECNWMFSLQSQRQAPPPTVGEQLPRRVCIRRSVQLARYGYTDRCIECQHARLGLKPADHNEECRARVVRHMTADDNLNQRVQIVQDRTAETTPPEARIGERDPAPEPTRKKVRFAERVEEQTHEGTVATNSRSTSRTSEQYKQQFQFVSQQQSNRECTIDAG